jgi:hypothetical protein
MGTLLLLIGAGLVFGLLVFFTAEEKSLKDADFSDWKGLFTEEVKAIDCIGKFNTVRYMLIYVITLLVYDLAIAHFVFIPNNFALLEVIAYTFATSLIGSWIILLVKWTNQPIIKLASSFMYGAGSIGAAGVAFAATYLVLS